MALRDVLAELDVRVKGLGAVEAASQELDRYLSAASPTVAKIEELRVKQQEAAELAGRLAGKIRELQKAEGDHAKEINELRLAMVRARDAAADYGGQADQLRKSEADLAKQSAKAADEAEKLRLKQDALAKKTGGAGGQDLVGAFRGAVAQVAAIIAAFRVLKGAVDVVVGTIREVVELGDQIDQTSERLGISASALQEWQFVAERADVSIEAIEKSFARLARNAESGTGPWRELGISVRDANGELRSQEDLFGEAITGLAGLDNSTRQAALAQQLFGRSGTELLTLIRKSPEEIDALRERFHELGGGLSDDVVEQSAAADDAMVDFEFAMRSLKAVLVADILPILTRLAEGAATIVAGFSELVRNSSLVETVLGTLAVVAGALVIALFPVLAPTLLLVGAFVALVLIVEDVVTAFRGGESVFGSWVESIIDMFGPTMTFAGLLDQLGVGWEQTKAQILTAIAEILGGVDRLQDALGIEIFEGLDVAAQNVADQAADARGRARSGAKIAAFAEATRMAERSGAVVPRAIPADTGKNVDARTQITINGATDTEATRRAVDEALGRRNRQMLDSVELAEPEPA